MAPRTPQKRPARRPKVPGAPKKSTPTKRRMTTPAAGGAAMKKLASLLQAAYKRQAIEMMKRGKTTKRTTRR